MAKHICIAVGDKLVVYRYAIEGRYVTETATVTAPGHEAVMLVNRQGLQDRRNRWMQAKDCTAKLDDKQLAQAKRAASVAMRKAHA